MQNLYNQISKLSENGDYFVKDKLWSEFVIFDCCQQQPP